MVFNDPVARVLYHPGGGCVSCPDSFEWWDEDGVKHFGCRRPGFCDARGV